MNALDTLNAKEAAEYLKCSVNTVTSKAAAGDLPCAKVGRAFVFLRGELANFIKGQYVKPVKTSGEEGCQSTSEKVRPISITGSSTKSALTMLRQERKLKKKQNK